VVTASGNIGTSGIFLTASPATGKNVITAGSTMNNHVPGYLLKLFKNNNQTAAIDIRKVYCMLLECNISLIY
jgi:hypothetical protein